MEPNPSNETEQESLPATDVLEDSSTSQESSTQDDKKGSMSDFVKAGLDQRSKPPEKANAELSDTVTSDEDKAEGSAELDSDTESDEKEADADKTAEEEATSKDEATEDEAEASTDKDEKEESESKKDTEAKGPVPLERFQEVNNRYKEASQKLTQAEPQLKSYGNIVSFCQANGISAAEFHEILQFRADLNAGNIDKIAPKIEEWHKQVASATGDKLPDDLQTEVDAGELKPERAKEISKMRAQSKFVEGRVKKTEAQLQADREQTLKQNCDSAIDSWLRQKQVSDPSFKPKTKPEDVDGKHEDVFDKYVAMLNATNEKGEYLHPVRNPQEMIALIERAYKLVDAKWKTKLTANGNLTRKRLPSERSSATTEKQSFENQKTLGSAIKVGMKERGYKAI